MEIFSIIVLALSGFALFYASSMRLIYPRKANFLQIYLTKPENELEKDVDLINEIRGIGAVMFLGGIIILLGIVMPELRISAYIVAIVLLFGVVLGRLVSFGVDGRPNSAIVKASFIEATLGGLNVLFVFLN